MVEAVPSIILSTQDCVTCYLERTRRMPRALSSAFLEPTGSATGGAALDVPMLNVVHPRVDVDGEVEQIRDHQGRARLQDVEALP